MSGWLTGLRRLQTIKATTIVLGCPPKLDNMTQCTLVAEHREIKLELTWTLPPSFHSAWRCYVGHWRRKDIVLPSAGPYYNTDFPGRVYAHWCNGDKTVGRVTNRFPTGSVTCFIRGNSSPVLWTGQKPMSCFILLNDKQWFSLPFKHLCFKSIEKWCSFSSGPQKTHTGQMLKEYMTTDW